MIDKNTASPTPTDAQPKAARPVGDEALREALKKVVSRALYKNQFKRDWREHIDPVANAVLSFLASHPTTGQETVATPRDGGVREALEMARHAVLNKVESYRPWVEKIPGRINPWQATLDAVDAALSAPGSAGPGERVSVPFEPTEDMIFAQTGLRPGAYRYDAIAAQVRGIYRSMVLAATPSPAQEPGTGDTGDAIKKQCADYGGLPARCLITERNWAPGITPTRCKLCPATPATTAETRGPAEGAR